mgnify:CR=1 FL=1
MTYGARLKLPVNVLSVMAIALNGGIVLLYALPAALIFLLENYRFPMILGLLLGFSINLFYVLIFRGCLISKYR